MFIHKYIIGHGHASSPTPKSPQSLSHPSWSLGDTGSPQSNPKPICQSNLTTAWSINECLLIDIKHNIYIYIYLQATAPAAELWDSSHRGLVPWSSMLLSMGTFWLVWRSPWAPFCRPWAHLGCSLQAFGGIGIHWGRQVAQISYFDNPLWAGASISRPWGEGGLVGRAACGSPCAPVSDTCGLL